MVIVSGDSIDPARRRLFHRLCQLDVVIGQTVGIMRRQLHIDAGIDVEPFRMMIELFRGKGCFGHETKGLDEIAKFERLGNRKTVGRKRPAPELRQNLIDCGRLQLLVFHDKVTPLKRLNDNMDRHRILFVCAGNICRSPLAEGIFRHLVTEAGRSSEFEIDSAGTGGWHQGQQPDRRSIAVAASHGIDISRQSARRIEPSDFGRFDLILAMDQDNLKNLCKAAPADALGKLHLFNAFALGSDKDIPDPYYGGREDFEAVYTMLLAGCGALLPKAGKALRAS